MAFHEGRICDMPRPYQTSPKDTPGTMVRSVRSAQAYGVRAVA